MGSISIREHIRWLPDLASEPTSTIVVTSPGRHFVDLRILRPQDHQGPWTGQDDPLPLSRLDWAIAGTSISTKKPDPSGTPTSYSTFHHWISSRTLQPELFPDAGFMYPQPNSLTLEKGSMVNPATGVDTPYEELWHDVEPSPLPGRDAVRVLVLQVRDDERGVRGSVVRLGRYVQGLVTVGDGVSLERWEFKDDRWRRTVRMGEEELPCENIVGDESLRERDVVDVGGREWKVVEAVGRGDASPKL